MASSVEVLIIERTLADEGNQKALLVMGVKLRAIQLLNSDLIPYPYIITGKDIEALFGCYYKRPSVVGHLMQDAGFPVYKPEGNIGSKFKRFKEDIELTEAALRRMRFNLPYTSAQEIARWFTGVNLGIKVPTIQGAKDAFQRVGGQEEEVCFSLLPGAYPYGIKIAQDVLGHS